VNFPVPNSLAEIAGLIDHTLLKPEASREDIERLCREALQCRFAAVCVNPSYVAEAARLLRESSVCICAVVGFPLGATLPQVKRFEAEECIRLGAREIDAVINIGALKSGDAQAVEWDIRCVVEAGHSGGALVKIILETALLSREEKIQAALIARRAGANFVKTSTGFGPAGATVEDVRLLREVVGDGTGVKAAGGVRTWEDVQSMVVAGASRIGTSTGVQILAQARAAFASGGSAPRSI